MANRFMRGDKAHAWGAAGHVDNRGTGNGHVMACPWEEFKPEVAAKRFRVARHREESLTCDTIVSSVLLLIRFKAFKTEVALLKRVIPALFVVFAVTLSGAMARAHFAMIIPSTDVVAKDQKKDITFLVQFTHPFEGGPLMPMDKPKKFGVVLGDRVTDLSGTLREKKSDGKSFWEADYAVKTPGDHVFFLEPKPYWEPLENKFIIHTTKVIVAGLGAFKGWDEPIAEKAGLPAEIVPLTRPYGLYGGNIFSGRVFKDGKPAPDVEVEVEWWGRGQTKAPTDAHVTQVTKTDANGVFHYVMPKSGWWGFSAIMEAPGTIRHEGSDKKVELAAVLWVYTRAME
jgi:cobalt/nickel transport protein